MLDLKEVWTEYSRTRNGAVREQIIMDAMPLVKYVVGKFAASAPAHCDREELIQCGIFGLINAIERFDPDKGVKFETYAILRIRGAVIDELRSRDWVPRSHRRMAREVELAANEIETRTGAAPNVNDLAEAMNLSTDEMEQALRQTNFVSFVSLDEQQGGHTEGSGDGQIRMGDLLEDTNIRPPSSRLELEERVCALGKAIEGLPEQERLVISLYYYEGIRLKDIGELFGVSESRVSQIHGRALVLLKLQMETLLGS
jgi:RNA polymerase sigma factor FliA